MRPTYSTAKLNIDFAPPSRRWAAVLDGDVDGAEPRTTRRAAARDAAWLRRHPARRDRVAHGHGGVVEVVEVTS